MKPLLAVLAGAAAGVALIALARALTGEGELGDRVTGLLSQLDALATDVREGMATREDELRVALGLDPAPPDARLDPAATRALLDDPTGWRARRG